MASGFSLGFLFGIPKAAPIGDSADKTNNGPKAMLSVNTNLEQISDWLTKIIVGVTLVELKAVDEKVRGLSEFIVKGSHQEASSGMAMIFFFAPFGFLAGYLLTRTVFSGLLAEADKRLADFSKLNTQPLPSLSEGKLELTGDAKRAAEEIASLAPTSAARKEIPPDALTLAQLGTGDPATALTTVQNALHSDPLNSRLHYLRALTLQQLGRKDDVIQSLQNARATLSPSSDGELKRKIYNSLAYCLLYVSPPDGFGQCKAICDEYLQQDPNGIDGAMWVNAACAAGQGAWHSRQKGEQENYEDYKRYALKAVTKALEVNKSWLPRLRSLYCPTPEQTFSGEDDLSVFHGEADFENVLGRC